jgi:soluble lytic murein transglycosylase
MRQLTAAILLGGLWGTMACGSDAAHGADGESVSVVDLTTATVRAAVDGDPLARQADSLVRAGRAWRASALLAPRLRAPDGASPEIRLAGARAAAAWEGWSEVERILRGADFLDRQFGGEGRELLTRADLERGQDGIADARLALDAAGTDPSRVERRVLLARAYDRANASDSASTAYLAAASRLPRVSDWLRLRAAGVLSDSATRTALYARLVSAVARARIPATEAQARERSGDFAGAARTYQAAGAVGSALRVSALAARDESTRAALAQRIVSYLAGASNGADVRQSLEVLDKLAVPLSAPQQLTAARAAAGDGTAARAIIGFERAGPVASLAPRDRYTYAGALLRAGRGADAARQFATLSGDPALAPQASYQRARALLAASDGAGARAALRATAATFATVKAAAAPALLLLADLQVDDGDIGGAAASLARIAERYPDASQAPLARFRQGLIAWNRTPTAAAAIFDSLVARYPTDDEASAARYWAARAHDRAGRKAEADRRWHAVIDASPLSYYAGLSAARLHVAGWAPPAGPDSALHVAAVDNAVLRILTLQQLGMDVENRFELDALADRAERVPADAPAIADGMLRVGEPARALRVATRALQRGASSRALLRAAYPVVNADALVDEARHDNLDPALIAGLIRQESSWNPHAVSPVGARGLMQLMPAVGRTLASSHHYPLWNPALLFEPGVSLELGISHLASSLPHGTPVARALAAYNAGASRVARWSQRPGADDPELFSEWIPFTETRDYVRIVQRNADVYRALYGLR